MLEFTTAFWDFCQMLIIVFILKFILDKYAHHLGFADKMMLLVLVPAGLTAVIYTKGQTILLPVLGLLGLFIYVSYHQPYLMESKIHKSYTRKIGRVFLAYFLVSMLFWWIIGLQNPDYHVVLHEDFHYYIQQAKLMMQYGVESNNFELAPAHANVYHYIDLWILALMSKIASHHSIIFHALFQPLTATLAYVNLRSISMLVAPKSRYAKTFVFWSLMISLPLLTFTKLLVPVQPIFLSAFANPKLLILVAFCSWMFLHFVQRNYLQMLIIAMISSLSFLSIAPAVLAFVGGVYLWLMIKKTSLIFNKMHLYFLGLMVLSGIYVYFLYQGAPSFQAKTQTETKAPFFENIHLIGLFVAHYAVYFLPLLFVGWRNFWAKCQAFTPMLLMPVGGLVATLLTRHLFVDAYQFYALSFVVFFTMFIPIIWMQFEWKTPFKVYVLVLFALIFRYNTQKYAYALYPKTDHDLLQNFQNKYPETKSCDMAYELSNKWKNNPYFIMPAYFGPDEFFLNNPRTQNFYWLGLYDGQMQNNSFKPMHEAIISKTQFQDFCKLNSGKTLAQNQLDFIQKNQLKAFFKDKENKLPTSLKPLVKDSIVLPVSGKTLYYLK